MAGNGGPEEGEIAIPAFVMDAEAQRACIRDAIKSMVGNVVGLRDMGEDPTNATVDYKKRQAQVDAEASGFLAVAHAFDKTGGRQDEADKPEAEREGWVGFIKRHVDERLEQDRLRRRSAL